MWSIAPAPEEVSTWLTAPLAAGTPYCRSVVTIWAWNPSELKFWSLSGSLSGMLLYRIPPQV